MDLVGSIVAAVSPVTSEYRAALIRPSSRPQADTARSTAAAQDCALTTSSAQARTSALYGRRQGPGGFFRRGSRYRRSEPWRRAGPRPRPAARRGHPRRRPQGWRSRRWRTRSSLILLYARLATGGRCGAGARCIISRASSGVAISRPSSRTMRAARSTSWALLTARTPWLK